jgi:4,5-DOPA dioxygenase extradiol
MKMLPSIYLSHGSPMLALTDVPARDFLRGLAGLIERPTAILVASAHWDTEVPEVTSVGVNETIHDFYGFPPELYRLRYAAPGAPALAERVAALLRAGGFGAEIDHARGLDHGAWAPLMLAFPAADIPVVQLSLQTHLGPAHHWRLGRALAPLRQEGVLVLGSGSFTHNLGELRRGDDGPEPRWVTDFARWFDAALKEGRMDDLVHYRERAPEAARNHPTDEHLLPIYVALGAAGAHARAERLHASATNWSLRMDAYAFHGEGEA